MIPPPKNILLSFAYYKNYDLDRLAGMRIIGDSGAFSAKKLGKIIDTPQLVRWVKLWQHRLSWVACLDVHNEPQRTRDNWKRMVDLGVPGVPTIHVGDSPAEMDFYAEQGVDFMGLGGMAGAAASPNVQLRWLLQVFKYQRENHPEMRFHGWGISRDDWLRLPWFSIDSSGWGASYRYGRLMLRHPLTGERTGIQLNGRGTFGPKVAEMLRDHYGVNPSDVASSTPSNRLMMVKLSALSASVQEQQMRNLHKRAMVTTPKWGQLGGYVLPDGPNQHLVLGGCGSGIREEKVMRVLNPPPTPNPGPHLHLVDGHPRHIEIVAALARGEVSDRV